AVSTWATTEFVAVSITPTLPTPSTEQFATYTRDPSGVTAMPRGLGRSATVATTEFVAVSITDTVLRLICATYTCDPSEVVAALAPCAPANTTIPTSHSAGRSPLIRIPPLI